MNFSRLRRVADAGRTMAYGARDAAYKVRDTFARHPYLLRVVPPALAVLGGLLSGTVDVEAHVGDNGILDTFTGYVDSITHSAGPDAVPWTSDDTVIVGSTWDVEFRAEDVGAEKLKEVASFNNGDYVNVTAHKHLAKNNIVFPDIFAYHGLDIEKAEPPPEPDMRPSLVAAGALGVGVFGVYLINRRRPKQEEEQDEGEFEEVPSNKDAPGFEKV